MEILEVMQGYFRGEKATGLLLVPVGLALVAFAAFVWRNEAGGFRWGLVVALGLVGAGATAGGAALAIKTGPQVAALERLYERDPRELAAAEIPRMQKVNANWLRLKIAWTVLAVIGCALALGIRSDWSDGLGAALLLTAALAMMVDTFAERRGLTYARALEGLASPE